MRSSRIEYKPVFIWFFVVATLDPTQVHSQTKRDFTISIPVLSNVYSVENRGHEKGQSVDAGLLVEFGRTAGRVRVAHAGGLVSDDFVTISRDITPEIEGEAFMVSFMNSHRRWFFSYAATVTLHAPADVPHWLPDFSGGISFLVSPNAKPEQRYIYDRVEFAGVVGASRVTSRDVVNQRITPFVHLGGEYVFRKKRRVQLPVSFGYRIPVLQAYRSMEARYQGEGGQAEYFYLEKSGFARYFTIGLRFVRK